MADTLEIFGVEYTGVTGIIAFDDYDFDTPPVITGDIVLGSDGFEVSGDGTITIKGTGMLG